jgi:anti-sigma factor RsiW
VSHLGDRLAAFVDGELDPLGRDRVLGHLAFCAACRAEAAALRSVKAALRGVGEPALPVDLLGRLTALPLVQRAADPRVSLADPTAAQAGAGGWTRRTAALPSDWHRPHPSPRQVLFVAGFATAACLATAFVVGGGPEGGAPVRPQVDRFTVEHAAVTGELPLSDPAAGAVTASFDAPSGP